MTLDAAFYMPFELRYNPHASQAHDRTLAWLARYGITDDERVRCEVERTVLATYMGCNWPDAPLEDLAVGSDFANWIQCFDDVFDAVPGPDPAQSALATVEAFVAVCHGRPTPSIGQEHQGLLAAFQDFWHRESGPMSQAWRARAAKAWESYLTSVAREVHLRTGPEDELPGVDEYIALRRRTIAIEVCSDLCERVSRCELPEEIAACDEMRNLRNAVKDVVWLMQDAASVEKEDADECPLNFVFVLERTLDHSRAEAIGDIGQRQEQAVQDFLRAKEALLTASWPETFTGPLNQHIFDQEHWLSGTQAWLQQMTGGRY
ncbi:terpene synthase family protein [Streptomyces sp. NPDC051243]|uniref:terpene synthase family protein n=1 Tax=Streptomyces sp. NPDC051243 TaxID=3365646 RepID=UPI0037A9B4DA